MHESHLKSQAGHAPLNTRYMACFLIYTVQELSHVIECSQVSSLHGFLKGFLFRKQTTNWIFRGSVNFTLASSLGFTDYTTLNCAGFLGLQVRKQKEDA